MAHHEYSGVAINDNATAHLGDHHTHQYFIPTTPRPEPHMVIPFHDNPKFVGRGDALSFVENILESPISRHVALLGLGGIGKSQIAIEYSYRRAGRESLQSSSSWTFWIHAGSYAHFLDSYRNIAFIACRSEFRTTEAETLSTVRSWLAGEESGEWLLILDNIDSMVDLNSFVRDYVPFNKGSILATSRDRNVALALVDHDNGLVLDVPSLGSDTALQLMSKSLPPGCNKDQAQMEALVHELGCVPLALTQAAAFLTKNTAWSIEKYLHHLRSSDVGHLLETSFLDIWRHSEGSDSILKTWGLTLEQINKLDPLAARMILRIGMLDSQQIPGDALAESTATSLENDQALRTLQDFSVIRSRSRDENVYDTHRLFHVAARIWLLRSPEKQQHVLAAIDTLANKYPSTRSYDDWPISKLYRPHISAIIDSDLRPQRYHTGYATLLLRRASYCHHVMGEYQGVMRFVEEALRDMPPLNEAEGVDFSVRCQAESLRLSSLLRQNDPQQTQRAATDGREIASQLKRDVGLEHPDALDVMCNTARAFVENGQVNDGEVLHNEVLEARKKVLGHEHLCTIESMENLALVFQSQDKYAKSERLLREVLTISKATLKSDDPSTITTMDNLVQLLAGQEGRLSDATALNLEALELNRQVPGPEHSNTLISKYNLACVYEKQQQMPEAIKLMTEVAESFENKLGQEHPEAKEARETSESWKEREKGYSSRKGGKKRRRT